MPSDEHDHDEDTLHALIEAETNSIVTDHLHTEHTDSGYE